MEIDGFALYNTIFFRKVQKNEIETKTTTIIIIKMERVSDVIIVITRMNVLRLL